MRLSARALLLAAGPAAYLVLFFAAPASLAIGARHVLGVAGWMALWWLTEAVPLAATSLLPIALFPLLGVASTTDAASPYANELVFLFLAGFFLATALERWGAHVRIAYSMMLAIGLDSRRMVLGLMLATGFISMWISNTATAAMMYPIALAIGALMGEGDGARQTRTALMLGVAYAASIGGVATLIGTPPNLIFAGAARQLAGRDIGFVEFMAVGLPIAIVLLPLTWAMLVYVLHRGKVELGQSAGTLLRERRASLGRLEGGEALTLAVFALTAFAWFFRERKDLGTIVIPGIADVAPAVSDATIGIAGASLLFILSGRTRKGERRPLLVWREAATIPWDVLLLFGGGLSLAAAMDATGLARWIGGGMSALAGAPPVLIYLGLAATVLVLSELASNTATAAMAMPIAASVAGAVDQPPIVLMLIAALAASTGFALPIATPPNAIVFGSGQVTVRQMARAGSLLDLIAITVIVIVVSSLAPLLFGA